MKFALFLLGLAAVLAAGKLLQPVLGGTFRALLHPFVLIAIVVIVVLLRVRRSIAQR